MPSSSTATPPIASRRSRSGVEARGFGVDDDPAPGRRRPAPSPRAAEPAPQRRRAGSSSRIVELEPLLDLAGLPHRLLQDAAVEVRQLGQRHDVRVAVGAVAALAARRGDAARAAAAAARTRTRRRTRGLRSAGSPRLAAACCSRSTVLVAVTPLASAKMRAASTNGTLPLILRSMPSTPVSSSAACSSPRQLSGGRLRSALSDICFRNRGLACARARDVGAQRVRELRLAPQRPEVEEDAWRRAGCPDRRGRSSSRTRPSTRRGSRTSAGSSPSRRPCTADSRSGPAPR